MIQEKPKTIKDAVVLALSKEWPLTARKLYNVVRKNYGFAVTYQAVHKVLKQMVEEGVLDRQERGYSINLGWIEKNKEFYEKLKARREDSRIPSLEDVLSKEITKIEFDNFYTFYKFMLEVTELLSRTENLGSVQCYHLYWTLAGSEKEQERFRNILKSAKNAHFLCRGNTLADRMLAKYYESFGAKVRTGVDCAADCDTLAGTAGYTIQVYFEKKLKENLDKFYSSIDDLSSSSIRGLYEQLFNKKTKITVVINKNPELSREIAENVKKRFYSKKGKESAENFVLNTLAEVDAFLIDLGSKIVPKDRKSTICLEWDHFWIPLFLDKEVYRKMKTLITNTVFYTITPAKTAIDKWCYEFWKKQNVKAKIGVGNRDSCVVVEDYVIRIFYPRDILKELDKIFSSAKNINDINTNELFHRLFEKKTKIPVVVERNPELAKQIRERIMSYFKSKE